MAKKITITQEEQIEANDAFMKMLRSGEDGTMLDALGAAWQEFTGKLAQAADKKGSAVKGNFALKWSATTGPSGDHRIVMDPPKVKTPAAARREFTIHTDQEGIQISGPVTRQADLPFTVTAPKANEPAPVNANKM